MYRRLLSMRTLVTTVGVTAALALTPLAPAHAAYTHYTDDFELDVDAGLCPFPMHITVHNEVDVATHQQDGGTVEIDHGVETDTLTANGNTVHGLPYHYTVRYTFDAAGNLVDETATGEIWRFQLPDGGIWSAAGHAIDFRNGVFVGSWQISDGLGPVCDALAG
jgi:hypothetical protein